MVIYHSHLVVLCWKVLCWCIWNYTFCNRPNYRLHYNTSKSNWYSRSTWWNKIKSEDDIVLDGTDSSSTDTGGRLLLEDVMDGDTGSFLSQHGMTFSNNDTSISGKLTVSGGIDGNLLATGNFIFEGSTVDAFETTLTAIDPTVDRTISLPNQTGLIGLIGGVRTADDEDIVLMEQIMVLKSNRLLLEDVMDGDTSGFLSDMVNFSNNNLSLSGVVMVLHLLHLVVLYLKLYSDSRNQFFVTDPTEDRTITLPNQSGIVDLLDGKKHPLAISF